MSKSSLSDVAGRSQDPPPPPLRRRRRSFKLTNQLVDDAVNRRNRPGRRSLARARLVAIVVVECLGVARQEDLVDVVIDLVEVKPAGNVMPEEVELLRRLHAHPRSP